MPTAKSPACSKPIFAQAKAARKGGFQSVDKVLAPQRALFSRSVSGIKKASFARFFDTFNSIGSVVPIVNANIKVSHLTGIRS